MRKLIGRYEPIYNEVMATLKPIASGNDLSIQRRAENAQEDAIRLFHFLHDIHDELARQESQP